MSNKRKSVKGKKPTVSAFDVTAKRFKDTNKHPLYVEHGE